MATTDDEIEQTPRLGDDEMLELQNLEDSQAKTTSDMSSSKRKKSKKAEFWISYVEYLDDKNLKRSKCIHCGKTYASDSKLNGSRNLKAHFSACQKNPMNKGKGKQSQLVFDNSSGQMKNWTFDAASAREYLAKMVIRDEMSFLSVEKHGLRDFVLSLCPEFKMASRSTIQRDCWNLYTTERTKVKMVFKDSCQRVCLTTDTWTSLNMEHYMCITAHFVDNDWILQKKVINFCKSGNHRGYDIGRAIEDCLSYWELERKLLTVTVDNASANDVACAYLSSMAKDKESIIEGKQCGEHVDKLRAIVKYVRCIQIVS